MIFIDDIPGQPMSPEAAERIREWWQLQVEAGNVSMGSFRLPDGKDLLKSLTDETDTES